MHCTITFQWDSEAAVWIATSDDVPGLVLESGSFDALVERVRARNAEARRDGGIVIACGMAKYGDETGVAAVFERADRSMYEDKSRLKAGQ